MVTLPTLVVFPVLLIATLFAFQAAVWMYQRSRAEAAAQRGAVAASVVPAGAARSPGAAARAALDDAEAAALDWFGDERPDGVRAEATVSGGEQDIVTVTVRFEVPSLLGDLGVRASAARQVELFRPAPAGIGT